MGCKQGIRENANHWIFFPKLLNFDVLTFKLSKITQCSKHSNLLTLLFLSNCPFRKVQRPVGEAGNGAACWKFPRKRCSALPKGTLCISQGQERPLLKTTRKQNSGEVIELKMLVQGSVVVKKANEIVEIIREPKEKKIEISTIYTKNRLIRLYNCINLDVACSSSSSLSTILKKVQGIWKRFGGGQQG